MPKGDQHKPAITQKMYQILNMYQMNIVVIVVVKKKNQNQVMIIYLEKMHLIIHKKLKMKKYSQLN